MFAAVLPALGAGSRPFGPASAPCVRIRARLSFFLLLEVEPLIAKVPTLFGVIRCAARLDAAVSVAFALLLALLLLISP